MNSIESAVTQANQRLKSDRVPFPIILRGERLYLRGGFPLKPDEMREWKKQRLPGADPMKQQWFNLRLKARTEGSIEKAEAMARLISSQIDLGKFRWRDWIKVEGRKKREYKSKSVIDFVRMLEADFWKGDTGNDPRKKETWRVGYATVIRSLPIHDELTESLLRDWIEESSPATRRREHYITVAGKLCKYAGFAADFSDLMDGITTKAINPRDIPSDDLLLGLYNQSPPQHQWAIGLMIVYGLRNHELFGVRMDDYPIVETADWTKTGQRFIEPIWIQDANGKNIIWDLRQGDRPKTWPPIWSDRPTSSNSHLGAFVTRLFSTLEIDAYDIRHAFARRCRDRGLDAWTSAAQMGHSQRIHLKTYQAWFSKRYHLAAVRAATGAAANE